MQANGDLLYKNLHAHSGDFTVVREILREDPTEANYSDPDSGKTPLMIAAQLGKFDLVESLVNKEANPDAQDKHNGWTALMCAIYHKYDF